jgi:hypothetical protein
MYIESSLFKEIIPLENCIKVEYNYVTLYMGCCHLFLNTDIFNHNVYKHIPTLGMKNKLRKL